MKFSENDEISLISRKYENFALFAFFAPKAGNVALANGILGILGSHFAKIRKIAKFSGNHQISPNLVKVS